MKLHFSISSIAFSSTSFLITSSISAQDNHSDFCAKNLKSVQLKALDAFLDFFFALLI